MRILTTRLSWIWNLSKRFEVFETTGRKHTRTINTKSDYHCLPCCIIFGITCYKYVQKAWLPRTLDSTPYFSWSTPPPPLGVIYGVYNFVVWWKIQYVFVSLCCSYLIYKCYSTNLKYQRINLINSNIHGHSAMFFRVFTTCILHFFF